jgi:hypothetical protein
MTSSHACTNRRPGSPATPLLAAAFTAMLAVVLTLLAGGTAAAQSLPQTCADDPVDADYEDRDEIAEVHLDAVDCATQLGIAQGLGSGQGEVFLPAADVRRDQMASFVARTLTEAGVELPAGGDHGFADVAADATHADAIAQLAAAGIVNGVTADAYEPSAPVRRDQMASFLIRGLAYQAGVDVQDLQDGDTPFIDIDADGTHGPNIAGLYNLGITAGTTADTYTPGGNVSRQAMASFVVRSFDAMQSRQTVADRDAGALSHTVFTFLSESGRCFQVKAGTVWVAECEPATDENLQVRTVTVADDFTVTTGLVTDAVARVTVESNGSSTDLNLTDTRSVGLHAWASPVLAADVDAIVAYDDAGTEIARTTPDDPTSPPFPADTSRDEGDAQGDPVVLTDVDLGRHGTYDRVVVEVADGGHAGWDAEYVDQATAQGSGQTIAIEGDAILRLTLTNMNYPTESTLEQVEPGTRYDGVGDIAEVYVGTTFEGITQIFVGVSAQTPFRVFPLDEPTRIVLDVVRESAAS